MTARRRLLVLHPLAGAGNIAALVALALLALSGPWLLDESPPAPADRPTPRGPRAERFVLVVIDALRNDASRDPAVMPHLGALAAGGGRSTASIDSLIPSTVAGAMALGGGRVASPLSFLQDFAAAPAPDGGVFQAVGDAGGTTAFAGPRLWADLYGRWIGDAHTTPWFGHDDQPLLDHTLAALRAGYARLIVCHFATPDEAAHQFGAHSPEYRAALTWCDAAVARIARAAGPNTAILVTSDHGSSDTGGHAGPERDVLVTPVVTHGPGLPAGRFAPLRQQQVSHLVADALGVAIQNTSLQTLPPRASSRLVPLSAGALLLAAAMLLLARVPRELARRRYFLANATLWPTLLLLLLGCFQVAAILAGTVLVVLAARTHWRIPRYLICAFVVGAALGAVRLAGSLLIAHEIHETSSYAVTALVLWAGSMAAVAPTLSAWLRKPILACRARPDSRRTRVFSRFGQASAAMPPSRWNEATGTSDRRLSFNARTCRPEVILTIVLAALAYIFAGVALALATLAVASMTALATSTWPAQYLPHRTPILAPVIAILLAIAAAEWTVGRTLSLSTIDVRAAFAVVHLPHGMAPAVLITLLVQGLPMLAAGIWLGRALAAARFLFARRWLACLGALLAAQAGPALLVATVPETAARALSLALLLHLPAEAAYLLLPAAGVLALTCRSTILHTMRRTGARRHWPTPATSCRS